MTSYTFESPARRRHHHDTITTPERFNTERKYSTFRKDHKMSMTPSPSCPANDSPNRAGKLSFDSDGFINGHRGRAGPRAHVYTGSKRRKLFRSGIVLAFFTIGQFFWWRRPLSSYINDANDNGSKREQEMDAWSLHQSDTKKREDLRRDKKKRAAINRKMSFVPIPKLIRRPLQLTFSSVGNSPFRNTFARVIGLDNTTNLKQHKQANLQGWLSKNETTADAFENESDMLKSQTVVYDSDRECVPMEDWQSTFHVSACPGCILSINIGLLTSFFLAFMQFSSRHGDN